MAPPGLDAYQIGWICALPIEVAAAKQMLDEDFGILDEQDSTDTNSYTLGRVGRPYVVIASLPGGQYGTTSATIVAMNMMRTFSQSLRIGLMVGIGGGIPSANCDVRLGDIVVSYPEGTCGGVLQYDMGKVVEGGKFQRTGSLNSPPRSLLTAVANMRASVLTDDPSYPEYIEKAHQDRDSAPVIPTRVLRPFRLILAANTWRCALLHGALYRVRARGWVPWVKWNFDSSFLLRIHRAVGQQVTAQTIYVINCPRFSGGGK